MINELVQKAQNQLNKELPFVLFKKPKQNLVKGIFQNDAELHYINDFLEQGFVFAPFNDSEKTILLKKEEEFSTSYLTKKNSLIRIELNDDVSDKEIHINLINKGISNIKKGVFDKVVLSRKLDVKTTTNALDLFLRLIGTYDNAFCYLWYHPKVGMWLGATPEILLRLENNRLTTMSLAGTLPYAEEEKPNWSFKELEEQKMVTNFICDALNDKVTNLSLSETISIKAGNLWHLRTKISGLLLSNKLKDVLDVLHPTPAVCGLPKNESKKFILENENYDRQFYTGFLGELNVKEEIQRSSRTKNQENQAYKAIKTVSEFYVNLRCMQLTDDKATLYIGGGITKDSISDKEWQETVNKSKTMLKILAK